MSPTEVQDLVENHLQQQLVKHFDPAKADSVFESKDGTPSWLQEMIKYKKWRQLFYQLIEKYPDCVLLNYVIKLISDAGHQARLFFVYCFTQHTKPYSKIVFFEENSKFKK